MVLEMKVVIVELLVVRVFVSGYSGLISGR